MLPNYNINGNNKESEKIQTKYKKLKPILSYAQLKFINLPISNYQITNLSKKISIGRSESSTVQLTGSLHLSRIHCEIEWSNCFDDKENLENTSPTLENNENLMIFNSNYGWRLEVLGKKGLYINNKFYEKNYIVRLVGGEEIIMDSYKFQFLPY